MNKILTMLALGLTLSAEATTVNWQPQDFLNSQIFSVTCLNGTGGLTNTQAPFNGVTNAIQDGLWTGGTNQPSNVIQLKGSFSQGTVTSPDSITYYAPGTVTTCASTNVWGTQNLFQDVSFWCDGEGRMPPVYYPATNNIVAISGYNFFGPQLPTIVISATITNTAMDSTVNFTFAPVWDGVHVSTNAQDLFVVGMSFVASSVGNVITLATNVPQSLKYAGAAKFRLLTVVNTDATAGATAIIRGIKMVGFKP